MMAGITAHSVRSRAGGFTLVELLFTLVIGSLVATGVLSLVFQQNSFYGSADDAMHAQKTARTAADLMGRELRMASGEDLISATADSVAVRFTLLRALVCDSTAADEATVFVYDSVTNSMLSGGSFVGTAYSTPYDSAWAYADGWVPTGGATGTVPKSTCTAVGAPGTGTDITYVETTGWTSTFADVPDPGSLIRVYSRLTYRFAPAVNFGTGTALWRGNAELLAPFARGAFSYVMSDGSVQNSVASGDFPDVAAVRVTATAEGDGAGGDEVTRELLFDIVLRN